MIRFARRYSRPMRQDSGEAGAGRGKRFFVEILRVAPAGGKDAGEDSGGLPDVHSHKITAANAAPVIVTV